jgi:hypothetical protein
VVDSKRPVSDGCDSGNHHLGRAGSDALAIYSLLQGRGPFVTGNEANSLRLVGSYIAIIAVSNLLLAAAGAESRAAAEQANRANSAKSEFLANMSHETARRSPASSAWSNCSARRAWTRASASWPIRPLKAPTLCSTSSMTCSIFRRSRPVG